MSRVSVIYWWAQRTKSVIEFQIIDYRFLVSIIGIVDGRVGLERIEFVTTVDLIGGEVRGR
jgi:hypothetical protein